MCEDEVLVVCPPAAQYGTLSSLHSSEPSMAPHKRPSRRRVMMSENSSALTPKASASTAAASSKR